MPDQNLKGFWSRVGGFNPSPLNGGPTPVRKDDSTIHPITVISSKPNAISQSCERFIMPPLYAADNIPQSPLRTAMQGQFGHTTNLGAVIDPARISVVIGHADGTDFGKYAGARPARLHGNGAVA